MKKHVVAFALFCLGLALGFYCRAGSATAIAGGAGGASPPAKGGLPATDQTKCYDPSGKEVSCDGAICPGQDGHYKAGCPSDGRFVDNRNGTVTDNCTGLTWQKEAADTNGDGQIGDDNSDALSWCDALAYCEKLRFAGHDDWRLPNVRELQSIVDYGRFKPSVDPVFGALTSRYWSSTSVAGGPGVVWYVDFDVGFVTGVGVTNARFHVRAVRTAP